MSGCDLIRTLHRHRQWVNRQLLEAAAGLSADQLHQTFTIGQGTVWRSLLHLYGAESVWLAALQGEQNFVLPGDEPGKLSGNQLRKETFGSIAELSLHWQLLDERWNDSLAKLTEASLEEPVSRLSYLTGQPVQKFASRADTLLHVCTHAQYTVAQVMNMYRQLEVTPLPEVMLIALARQEWAERSLK